MNISERELPCQFGAYLLKQKIAGGGMAELYLPDADAWRGYRESIQADGMERWVDPAATVTLRAHTEMIGIA